MQLTQRKSPKKTIKWLGLILTASVIVSVSSWYLNQTKQHYCTQQPLSSLLQVTLNSETINQGYCTLRTGIIILLIPLFWVAYQSQNRK